MKKENEYYTVCQMGRLTGTTRKSLYLYDKEGILKPLLREGPQQHKLYGKEQLDILKDIEKFRKAGFYLSDIKHLMEAEKSIEKDIVKGVLMRLNDQLEEISEYIQRTQEILKDMEQEDFSH